MPAHATGGVDEPRAVAAGRLPNGMLAPEPDLDPATVGVIEGLGEFLQGLLARGPAQQVKTAELPG